MGKLECFGATHLGFRKQTNEDQFVIAEVRKSLDIWQTSLTLDDKSRVNGNSLGKMLAVADGAGSPESATRASVITIERLIDFALNQFSWSSALTTDSSEQLRRELIAAFWSCQNSIVQEAEVLANVLDRDMASSVTLAIVNWPSLHLASVGNCRCYRLRGDKLEQLTTDDTLPMASIPLNEKTGSETISDLGNDVVVNIVGGVGPELVPRVDTIELAFGDTILLCTDGLTKQLIERKVAEILKSPLTAADCCKALINEALLAGGDDNVTVVVGRFMVADENSKTLKETAEIQEALATERVAVPIDRDQTEAIQL
jgi:protein phosphatase